MDDGRFYCRYHRYFDETFATDNSHLMAGGYEDLSIRGMKNNVDTITLRARQNYNGDDDHQGSDVQLSEILEQKGIMG